MPVAEMSKNITSKSLKSVSNLRQDLVSYLAPKSPARRKKTKLITI